MVTHSELTDFSLNTTEFLTDFLIRSHLTYDINLSDFQMNIRTVLVWTNFLCQ